MIFTVKPKWLMAVPEDLQIRACELYETSTIFHMAMISYDAFGVDALWHFIICLAREREQLIKDKVYEARIKRTPMPMKLGTLEDEE